MKVLLTGANGYVGSHILDALRNRGTPVVLLLRPTSQRRFIEAHLPHVQICEGAVTDPASLREAVRDVTHIVHCAGITKALRVSDFTTVNQAGTAHLVAAANERAGQIRRLVYISSLAACGPGTRERPVRETDPPQPVSEYGRSKRAAERAVIDHCQIDHVILRPPGVYGPRDSEFLRLFRAVQRGWTPVLAGGTQSLSLVYAPDLAAAVLTCLEHPAAAGRAYHVAAPEVVTGQQFIDVLAGVMGRRPRRLSIPGWLVRLSCVGAGLGARVSGRANVLDHDKHRELLAPGWVCDPSRLQAELGFQCSTRLAAGLTQTLAWYRAQRWLSPE